MSKMLGVNGLKSGSLCESCGKLFDGPAKLAEHSRMHTGEKPFARALCLQSFSRRCHLLEHLRAHSCQRRFLCRFCGCTFAGSFALTRHERSHSNERPHKCDLCPADFKQRHHLLQHLRRIHFKPAGHKLPAATPTEAAPCWPKLEKPENGLVESVFGVKSEVKTEVGLSVPLVYRGCAVPGCFAMHITDEDFGFAMHITDRRWHQMSMIEGIRRSKAPSTVLRRTPNSKALKGPRSHRVGSSNQSNECFEICKSKLKLNP